MLEYPIFDKEKEQKRLQEAQIIGEIGSQAIDIAATQGKIAGQKAAKDPAALNAAREQLAAGGKPYTESDVAQQAYNNAMASWGTGSAIQQGIQAATAAIQGLAGHDLGQALSGAAAPYLAEQIHKLAPDETSRAMAHAVVGAIVSYEAGNSAAAGAAGAVSGELMAQLVMNKLYPGKQVSDLTETEKQTVSVLGTLAAGLAGGITGGSAADGMAGAQAGNSSVENNTFNEAAEYLTSGKKPEDRFNDALKQLKEATADFKEKNCAGLSAEACGAKMEAHRDELLRGFADAGLDFVPVVGTIKTLAEAQSALDYLTAAASLIPGERVASAILKNAENALKKGDLAEASKLINKASDDVTSANYFRQERKYWSAEPVQFKGNKVYQRNDIFNPQQVSSWKEKGKTITGTNVERMASGRAPIGVDGKSVNLHHMTQSQDGPIAEVTQSFHQGNSAVIHINPNTTQSGINRPVFDKWKEQYWQQRAANYGK